MRSDVKMAIRDDLGVLPMVVCHWYAPDHDARELDRIGWQNKTRSHPSGPRLWTMQDMYEEEKAFRMTMRSRVKEIEGAH